MQSHFFSFVYCSLMALEFQLFMIFNTFLIFILFMNLSFMDYFATCLVKCKYRNYVIVCLSVGVRDKLGYFVSFLFTCLLQLPELDKNCGNLKILKQNIIEMFVLKFQTECMRNITRQTLKIDHYNICTLKCLAIC